jgi:hypothetical protein
MTVKLKAGVPDDTPHPEIQRARRVALNHLAEKYQQRVLHITSTFDGKHGKGSLHYVKPRRGEDWRLPDAYRAARLAYLAARALYLEYLEDVRAELGPGFDVLDEGDHVHAEFDPKTTKA